MTNEEGQTPFERPDLRLIKGIEPDSTEFDDVLEDDEFLDDPAARLARQQAAKQGTHPSAHSLEKPDTPDPNNG